MPLFEKGHPKGTDVMVKCQNEQTKDTAYIPGKLVGYVEEEKGYLVEITCSAYPQGVITGPENVILKKK